VIDATSDYTRLALDTLAYCSMSYRLNSFYTETQPPFGQAMTNFLKESFLRSSRPAVITALMTGATAKYAEDMKYMTDIANKSAFF
jgi:cytochrome P450/NADPH-cytochrome P450 reductase